MFVVINKGGIKTNVDVNVYLIRTGNKFLNPSNCKCEVKKRAVYLLSKECEEINDNKSLSLKNNKTIKENKTISAKEINSIDSCKRFLGLSVLFLLVSVTITGLFIYFFVNSWPKNDLRF